MIFTRTRTYGSSSATGLWNIFLEPPSNHPSPDLPPKMSYLLKCLPPRIKSKFEASLEVQLRSIIKITEYVPLIPDLINHLKKIRTKLNNFDIWPPRLRSRFFANLEVKMRFNYQNDRRCPPNTWSDKPLQKNLEPIEQLWYLASEDEVEAEVKAKVEVIIS